MRFLGEVQKISSRWECSNGNTGNGSSGRKLATDHPSSDTKRKTTRGMVPGTWYRAIHVLPLEANFAESPAKHPTGRSAGILLCRACLAGKILQNAITFIARQASCAHRDVHHWTAGRMQRRTSVQSDSGGGACWLTFRGWSTSIWRVDYPHDIFILIFLLKHWFQQFFI